jgi:hypothetical protein
MVTVDAPCTNCGYSLRGLDIDSVCPECARPVRLSLERRRLGLASAEYLRALHLGAGVLLLGLILAVAIGGVSALQYTTLGTFRYAVPLVVWPSLDFAVSVLVAFGIWKLSIDDPGLPPHDQARGNARTLRTAALALPVVHCVRVLIATATGAAVPAPIAPLLPLMDAASGVVRAMLVFGLWLFIATGLCNLLRWFAARLPDRMLFAKARSAGRMLPFVLMPAALGPAGLIPGSLWLAVLVGLGRGKIARAQRE